MNCQSIAPLRRQLRILPGLNKNYLPALSRSSFHFFYLNIPRVDPAVPTCTHSVILLSIPTLPPARSQLLHPNQNNINLDTTQSYSKWVPLSLAYVTLLFYSRLLLTFISSQIQSVFRAIGSCLMAIVNAIGSICHAIISGVVTVIDVIISCLTCGYCGKRRRGRRSAV